MFYVYILKSLRRNYYYVGLTGDIDRRFLEHQQGNNKTTKAYRPFKRVHSESFKTRNDSREREKYLKSGSGREWIRSNFK